MFISSHSLWAQVTPDSTVTRPSLIASPSDTSRVNAQQNSPLQSSPSSPDRPPENPGNRGSDIQDAVQFQSTDSLIVDFRNGRKIGRAHV